MYVVKLMELEQTLKGVNSLPEYQENWHADIKNYLSKGRLLRFVHRTFWDRKIVRKVEAKAKMDLLKQLTDLRKAYTKYLTKSSEDNQKYLISTELDQYVKSRPIGAIKPEFISNHMVEIYRKQIVCLQTSANLFEDVLIKAVNASRTLATSRFHRLLREQLPKAREANEQIKELIDFNCTNFLKRIKLRIEFSSKEITGQEKQSPKQTPQITDDKQISQHDHEPYRVNIRP